jgi:hypothetical protein
MRILPDSVKCGILACGLWAVAPAGTACYSSNPGDDDAATEDDGDTADGRPDDGGTDAVRPPFPTRFVLRFISDIPETVYIAGWEASSTSGHWLTLLDGGTAMAKADSCGTCNCDECPVCSMCGAPCMELTPLASGGSVEYSWDGRRWETDGACGSMPCEDPAEVPAGAYAARFCWGTGRGGSSPCDELLLGERCAEVSFTLPDADGVVEYVVDNGG